MTVKAYARFVPVDLALVPIKPGLAALSFERARQGQLSVPPTATRLAPGICRFVPKADWSERGDLNSRPLAPEASALPGCATLRPTSHRWEIRAKHLQKADAPRRHPPSPKLSAIMQPARNRYSELRASRPVMV